MLLRVVVPKTLFKKYKIVLLWNIILIGLHALVMKDLRRQHLIDEDGSDFSDHKNSHKVLTLNVSSVSWAEPESI